MRTLVLRCSTIAVLVGAILWAAGCSTTMKVKAVDPQTGRFPTSTTLKPKDYLVKKTLDVNAYKSLLYIRSGTSPGDQFRDFLAGSFKNLGFFDSVKDKSEMESYIISKGLADTVPNISDLVGLHNLQKQIGNFLVADYSVQWVGGYDYRFDVILVDPATGETVLHVTHKAINWAGLDEPLFYPVFNAVKDWIDENKK